MVNSEITWGERIPVLRDYASQLLSLANDIVSARTGPRKMDDFLGTMIDVFVHIQIDHLKSICILIDAGQSQDAEIISRSSVEGMYLLLWAAYSPKDNPGKTRPFYWWAYLFIEDYRRMIETDIDKIDLEIETTIFQHIQEFGYMFLTKENKDLLRQHGAKALPNDPFINGWPSENMSMVINELKTLKLLDPKLNYYVGMYRGLSKWLHSSQQGIGRVFHCDKDKLPHNVVYCNFMGARALVIGHEALARSLALFNNHFELRFGDRITDLETHFFEQWPESKFPMYLL